jgi:hypothetical protein
VRRSNNVTPTEHEQRDRLLFGALLALLILTRIPLLSRGYGADGDAWRVARSAWTLWTTGHYEVSRFPGFPLHELLMAPVVGIGGALIANAATLIASLLTLLAWRSLTIHTTRHPLLLVATFALTPLIMVNSACTMDYVWSLLCILLSLRSAQQGSVLKSGIWTGLAAGFRLPNIVAVLPVAVLLFGRSRKEGSIAAYVSTAIVTAFAAFLPVFVTYGLHGWLEGLSSQFSGTSLPFADHLLLGTYRGMYALGLLPAAVALTIVIRGRKQFMAEPDPLVRSSLTGILTFTGLFFLFPFQREYIIPIIPFLLICLDRIGERAWMRILLISTISYCLVNIDIVHHHGTRGDPGLSLRPGPVIGEWQEREALMKERATLPRLRFPEASIVMTGLEDSFTFENEALVEDTASTWSPVREPVYRSRYHAEDHFTSVLSRNEVTHLMNAHIDVYYLPSRKEYIESVVGYNLGDFSIRSVPGD